MEIHINQDGLPGRQAGSPSTALAVRRNQSRPKHSLQADNSQTVLGHLAQLPPAQTRTLGEA